MLKIFFYTFTLFIASCQTLTSIPDLRIKQKRIILRKVDSDLASPQRFCLDTQKATYLSERFYRKLQLDSTKNLDKRQRKLSDSKARMAAAAHARRELSPLHIHVRSDNLYDMPLEHNAMVEKWLQYYQTSGKVTLLKWLIRAESLREQIQQQLELNGVPKNLFYLAMIESGLNVSVKSRAKAVGTWQFMPRTGLQFELKNNYWIDERRDPIKSTVAAAKYLKKLYTRFGSWHLALAAYNAGPSKVRRAISKVGSRDYWELINSQYLRTETKNYVPKFIAAYTIAMAPELYGFYVSRNSAWDYPTSYLSLNKTVKIDDLASKLGIGTAEIMRWNPELKRDMTPPNQKTYRLRVSNDLLKKFMLVKNSLKHIKVSDMHRHRVRRGDTLTAIARKYKIPLKTLRSLNPKVSPRRLLAGQTILVPF